MVHMLSLRMWIKNMDTTGVIHIFILSVDTLFGKPLDIFEKSQTNLITRLRGIICICMSLSSSIYIYI